MKDGIHPTYYERSEVVCACGRKAVVGSTLEKIKVEICSACHPAFTGRQKILDAAGRVERFQKRQAQSGKRRVQKERSG